MANRKFEMYEYRRILLRMRLGQADRALSKAGLMGRRKLGEAPRLAKRNLSAAPAVMYGAQAAARSRRFSNGPEPR